MLLACGGRQHVPHLGLAVWLAVPMGNLVVGVYLNGQGLAGVVELDEQQQQDLKALILVK